MKLYNKSELTHSRIFFDKKPPPFLTVFVLFTMFLLVLAFVISSLLIRTYVVNAQGTVVTKDTTFVGAFTDGILVELRHEEGSFVHVGDVLFTVSSGNEGLQYQALLLQLEQQEEMLEVMDLFEISLNDRVNHMQNEGIQQEYYARVEHYLNAIQQETRDQGHTRADLNERRQRVLSINSEIRNLENDVNYLNTTEQSLRSQLQTTPNEITEYVEPEIPVGMSDDELEEMGLGQSEQITVTNPEYERLEQEIESTVSEREGKQSEIDGKISQREGYENEIMQMERQLESTNAGQTRIQLLAELGTSRTTAQTRITELESQITAHQIQDGLYEVLANNNGYVHYLAPLREGMAVQRMQAIAEISENRYDHMQVEVFIDARQISRVELGQDVNVAIEGVNVHRYGTISGTLKSIDTGTMIQETPQGNMVFYRGIVMIHETYLEASNGDVVNVLRSMPVTARIVYERETYLNWLLNMLNFRNE